VAWYYENCSSWPPSSPPSPPETKIDILLDYGNSTRVWYENVELPGFPSILKATKGCCLCRVHDVGDRCFCRCYK
jgi:hypothetical protein